MKEFFTDLRDTFVDIPSTIKKVGETASNNIGFLLISILCVAALIGLAYGAEIMFAKKTGISRTQNNLKVKKQALISMLSAISIVLMLFKFPLWFAPGFYTLDFSELPVIIGAFALGPVAGITIEFIKILLNLLINGTMTAFVGEFANFLMGCAYIIPASAVYYYMKSKKGALIGLISGTVFSVVLSAFMNAYVLIPKYMEVMSKDLNYFVQQGAEKNGLVDSFSTFIFFAVIPFNLIKFVAVSLIVLLIYKQISKVIKQASH